MYPWLKFPYRRFNLIDYSLTAHHDQHKLDFETVSQLETEPLVVWCLSSITYLNTFLSKPKSAFKSALILVQKSKLNFMWYWKLSNSTTRFNELKIWLSRLLKRKSNAIALSWHNKFKRAFVVFSKTDDSIQKLKYSPHPKRHILLFNIEDFRHEL